LLADTDHIKSPENRNYDSINAFPSYIKSTSITDEYEFKQEIGKGSYSVVYLAIHIASRMEYAVKVTFICI
jgi:p90 ribosomal S6 kinase